MLSLCHFVFLVLLQFLFANGAKDSSDICVLGGGISGLAITQLLQEKGYDVSLFERDSRWGGKVATYRSPDNRIIMEKGAILIGPDQYYINQYIKKYGLSLISYDILDITLIDPKTAGQIKYRLKQGQRDRMTKSYEILEKEMEKIPLSHYSTGYVDLPLDSPLSLPYGQFLEENGVPDLNVAGALVGVSTGYGDVDVVPTIYYNRLLRPNDTVKMVGGKLTWFTAKDGFDNLITGMAKDVKNKFLNHKAISIFRSDTGQVVTFQVNGKTLRTHTCGKTLLAFPPTLKNIHIIEELSPEETEIFSQVKVHKYTSHGHIIPSFTQTTYYGFTAAALLPEGRQIFPTVKYPEGKGELVCFSKALGSKNPFAYVGFSWIKGDFDTEATPEDVRMMDKKVQKLAKKIHPFSKMLWRENWEYFPHVTSESIRNGFFKKLDKIQGNGGIYYASTLLTMEMMDPALEMAHDMVKKYF